MHRKVTQPDRAPAADRSVADRLRLGAGVTIGEFVDTCEFSREQNAAAAATRVPSGSAACSYSLLLQILSCAAQLAVSPFH